MSRETDTLLLTKYATEVAAFRKFCIEHGGKETFEECDFRDFSFGFFIALGVTGDITESDDPEDNEEFYDAHVLSTICRYQFHYWEGQSL